MAVQTIEQTSKKFKLQIVLSILIIILGTYLLIIGIASGPSDSGILFVSSIFLLLGISWLIVVKFLTWWHHG